MLLTPFRAPVASQAFYEVDSDSQTVVDYRAKVISIEGSVAKVRLIDGVYQRDATVEISETAQQTRAINVGSTIVVQEKEGRVTFFDAWRLPIITGVIGVFFALVVIVGGRRGAMSTLGLVVSILIIAIYVIPAILAGWPAFWVCLSGALIIAAISLFMAHGLRERTAISFIVIVAVLLVVAILTLLIAQLLHLSGVSDDVSFYVSYGSENISMQGLFVGGVVIAALGVLDDIVTAQVAAVDELYKANPMQPRPDLIRAAFSVGKEHVASLVNTLALAYVGVSLPLIVLYTQTLEGSPLMLLNSEFIVSEVVRTVIASSGILLAVPLSIYAAIALRGRLSRKPISPKKTK